MKLKPLIIDSFSKMIFSSMTFTRIKGIVERLESEEMTGVEKKSIAIAEIKQLGIEIAEWAVNLAIELAVAWFRSKQGQIPVK